MSVIPMKFVLVLIIISMIMLASGCLQEQNPGNITPTYTSPPLTPPAPASKFSATDFCASPIIAYGFFGNEYTYSGITTPPPSMAWYGFPGNGVPYSSIAGAVLQDCRAQQFLEKGGKIVEFTGDYAFTNIPYGDDPNIEIISLVNGPALSIQFHNSTINFIVDDTCIKYSGKLCANVHAGDSVPDEVFDILNQSCETPSLTSLNLSSYCVRPILVYGYRNQWKDLNDQWKGANASHVVEIALADCRVKQILDNGGQIMEIFRLEAGKGTREHPEPVGPGMRVQYQKYAADFIVSEKIEKIIGIINMTSYPAVPPDVWSVLNQSCGL
ncbi:MAG TPA: hypothetical protein VMT31_01410 [Methanomicrobiales archaeon]|nr:hypothetical protein [Methanomicrobiales archaeon]